LMVGLVMPAVMILLWKDEPQTIAEVLNRVEQPRTQGDVAITPSSRN
jgi:predicted transcriptional regulator